jgi:hypothetical protein
LRINIAVRISGAFLVILLLSTAIPFIEVVDISTAHMSENSRKDIDWGRSIIAQNDQRKIAVVQPIFTATAYSNAFYDFYSTHASSTEPFITADLEDLNVTVKYEWGWSQGLFDFLYSTKADLAGLSLVHSVELIDEIDVIRGALFDEERRVYDVLILGFTEYVTLEEYNYYKRFVETGGTLIFLDACNFLAEVKYYPPATPGEEGYLSLVKGHGWEFNGTHAWKSVYHRWPEENRNWIGSNFWKYWSGTHYDYFQANTSHPISAYLRGEYGTNVETDYTGHEENKLENLTDTQIIGHWNFVDPSEAPEEPVVAYQHMYGDGCVFHTGIMASDVMDEDEFLQAFLVSAVRMSLSGAVGDWDFGEASSIQVSLSILNGDGSRVSQEDDLSGNVTFRASFRNSFIVKNLKPYSLRGVNVSYYREDSELVPEQAFNVTMISEDYLNWSVTIDTTNQIDWRYVFEIRCRFTSITCTSNHLDSTLMDTTHRILNDNNEIKNTLYMALGSFSAFLVLVVICIVFKDKRSLDIIP